MFEIKFDKSGSLFDSDPQFNLAGKITVSNFYESLIIPIHFWSKGDYLAQWKSALNEIVSSNESRSALIVQMLDPEDMEYVICWPLYRSGDIVYIQNRIIGPGHTRGIFKLEKLEEYIGHRESSTTDGGPVSEWEVSVDAIQASLNKLTRIINKKEYSEDFKTGLYMLAAYTIASLIAAPFTSIWVPVIVVGSFATTLLILSAFNWLSPKTEVNPLIRSFEQISILGKFPV
jgi:hypothetical protein